MWFCFLRGIRLTTRFGITPCARPRNDLPCRERMRLLQRKIRAIYSQTHSPALLRFTPASVQFETWGRPRQRLRFKKILACAIRERQDETVPTGVSAIQQGAPTTSQREGPARGPGCPQTQTTPLASFGVFWPLPQRAPRRAIVRPLDVMFSRSVSKLTDE